MKLCIATVVDYLKADLKKNTHTFQHNYTVLCYAIHQCLYTNHKDICGIIKFAYYFGSMLSYISLVNAKHLIKCAHQ